MRGKKSIACIKVTAMVLTGLLAMVCFTGCGDSREGEVSQNPETTAQPQDEQEGSDTFQNTEQPEVDRSAVFELFSHMTVGWNLGNTFDSIGAGNSLKSETYWGNPKTTKEMIDEISKQGINTIRIPVTWAEHVGPGPDYPISEEWLDRIEEVVDYCLEDGMYVILDTHHEPDYWMLLDGEHLDDTKAELAAIWTQVAERFKDRDEHLLFEGMNEPRTKGSANEWSGGTGLERVAVNELNGIFIDAVRATGGNNGNRCLIICTYGNNASVAALQNLKIYDDANIAVAVHMYTPYFFTYDPDEGSILEWDGSLKSEISGTARLLDSFLIKEGVPVIITEFGAVNKEKPEEVIKWLEDYLETMNGYGIKCIWWDNGNYTYKGEKFAIFNRKKLTWYSQDIADALVEFAVGAQQ